MGDYSFFKRETLKDIKEQEKREDELMDRQERFQLEVLNKQLVAINRLADSIVSLVSSLANTKSSNINIYIDKDVDITEVIELVNQINMANK